MNILEYQEQRLNLQNELTEIIKQAETRSLEESENTRLAEIRTQIDAIDAEIKNVEEQNKQIELKNNENKITKKMEKQIRLVDLVNAVVNGNATDEQRAFINGKTISTRGAINAGTATEGQEVVPEDKMGLEVAVRNASILNKMGATWFANAQGNISLPFYAGSNVGWKGEIAAAADGAGAFSETILSPKRLTGYVDVSFELLKQANDNVEAILVKDLADSIAEKFDATIFSASTGSTTQPAGLFAEATTGTSLSAIDYDAVLAHEEAIEDKNGSDFMFIVSPKVKYALKGVDKATGFGKMVYEGGEIDGYNTISSNSVVSKGMLAIVPRDLAAADWGMEITVDSTSQAINGCVRLVVNYYCDAALRGNKRMSAEIFS